MNMKAPKIMWVLIDISNAGCGWERGMYNYLWWFHSREAARDHKKEQAKDPMNADLVGPFKYVLADGLVGLPKRRG